MREAVDTGSPGLLPAQLFEQMDDRAAADILPKGAFRLIQTLRPELLSKLKRAETLGQLIPMRIAVDDQHKRSTLLTHVPKAKSKELEMRVGSTIDELSASANLDYEQRKNLLGFFGVETIRESPPSTPPSTTDVQASRGLFPHQKRAAALIEHYLYFETGRAMLHLPTGVGKTRTAMSIVASHLRRSNQGLVVWLANTRELLEQAAEEFEATWAATGDRTVTSHRFWSDQNPPPEDCVDGIIIAGLSKLHSYGKVRERLWELGDRVGLVVFDEAHQAVAPTYQDLIETITTRNPKTAVLGLSATPGRTWGDIEADIAVAELFHYNKVTLDFDGENPITRLTTDGYLANAIFSPLDVQPGLEFSSHDLSEISRDIDVPVRISDALGDDEQRNIQIVQRLFDLAERHQRILVFAASVNNALLLASICRAGGYSAEAITGTTEKLERERAISKFKRPGGSTRILTNFGVLTTGFDAPKASAALIARPTKSLVLYSQMVGRVIRGPKAGGTPSCEIVTIVDTTIPGFRDIAEAFTNWEDIWEQ